MRNMLNRVATHSRPRNIWITYAIVLLLIVGIVAMHSFPGNMTAHDALLPVSATAESGGNAHPTEEGPPAGPASAATADCDASCAHGTAPDHGHLGMLMLCMLALLTGLLFLIRPALFRLSRAAAQSAGWLTRALPAPPAARPPSLFALSISRT